MNLGQHVECLDLESQAVLEVEPVLDHALRFADEVQVEGASGAAGPVGSEVEVVPLCPGREQVVHEGLEMTIPLRPEAV